MVDGIEGWRVTVAIARPVGSAPLPEGDARLSTLATWLGHAYDGTVDPVGHSHVATVYVSNEPPIQEDWQALEAGRRLVVIALEGVGLADWIADPVEAVPEGRPSLPMFLGHQEVSHALGVSRQRLLEMRRSPRFPKPVAELASGPVWMRPVITAFLSRWERKPGRPTNRCDGVLVVHATGEHTCTVCTTSRRDPDALVHAKARDCSCPECHDMRIA